MGLEEKYPKSGLYRENKPEVEQYADKMMDELLDGNKCFTPKTMDEIIIAEFRIHERDLAMITPEEKQNVMNFAQYASKRLAGAALQSYEWTISRSRLFAGW